MAASSVQRIVSSTLRFPQFPVGTIDAAPGTGDHVMGVAVMAWLSHVPVRAWGEEWATHGSFDVRFREHLVAGLDLEVQTEHLPDGIALTVCDDATNYATGVARRRGSLRAPFVDLGAERKRAVPNTREALAGLVLAPVRFTFDASRDLAFTATLDDGSFWRSHRWAHPAWLVSGGNAAFKHNVEFESKTHWHHAGIESTMHAPVEDGDEVMIGGCVTSLFDSPRNQFAVVDLGASVDSRPVMSMRMTFAYRPAAGPV